MQRAIEHQIPAGMLQSLDDVANCEHLDARSFWDRIRTPWGAEVKFPGAFSVIDGESRGGTFRAVPRLGEHNDEVYCGRLGRTGAELERLRAEGRI